MNKSANIIRQEFIDFFKEKGHSYIPSAPVVPQDDPTLLFTNAGMNQFKAIFLGENRNGLKRVANSQKCMRVSGKHNDLEEVGVDHHHHTFFEMLGNWSFGDYYKKEAIIWAWELLTEKWNLPKDKLYATVFEDDKEAEMIWKTETDIDPGHISRHGPKDNFWEMGETGPCGPCSEIHFDIGPGYCENEGNPDHTCGVNIEGCGRFIEIWNLVFIQFNREKDSSLSELASKHVDTGMGFERIVRVIQNKDSNYATDLFTPIINEIEKLSGMKYDAGHAGTPFRVIADHIRSLVFSITDGAFPSNEGRGYVIRRLLRRAYRFGRELGFTEPFLYKAVPVVVDIMGDSFHEITQRLDYVTQIIKNEEARFGQTLDQGLEKINRMIEECNISGNTIISGADVFSLYDTYGFPMDLTRLIAAEHKLTIDEKEFGKLMEAQRKRARDTVKSNAEHTLSTEGWVELRSLSATEFVGYNSDQAEVRIGRYKITKPVDDSNLFSEGLVVFDKTPFYAEMGGQVGDTGILTAKNGLTLEVNDTIKLNDITVHKVTSKAEAFPVDQLSQPFTARIKSRERACTQRNHSATHLLQSALKKVLGNHISQSGSRVSHESLRFDFTHFKALENDEIRRVEEMVNEWILEDFPLSTEIKATDEAKKEGAIALFGEKYGENVRVVSMGDVSKELCGGTHVHSTGNIGLFHIISESSIAAGVRRIEAVTGMECLRLIHEKEAIVSQLTSLLKINEKNIFKRVTDTLAKVKALEAENTKLSQAQTGETVEKLIKIADTSAGGSFPWVAENIGSIDKKKFTDLTDRISDTIREKKLETIVIFLAADVNSKALFSASAGKTVVKQYGIHCGELVKAAAIKAGGGGGGSPVRAQAGGNNLNKIQDAIDAAVSIIQEKAGIS